jgi:hypothetical protein
MIRLKYNSWDDVSIEKYEQLLKASDCEDDLQRTINILAVLTDEKPQDIENINLEELNTLTRNTKWVNEFDFDKSDKPKTFKMEGIEYNVTRRVPDMTVAQYADFQAYFGKTTDMEILLSIFVIPKGHKYGEGYDMEDLQRSLKKHMPITTANSIIYFFLKGSLNSLHNTLISLESQLKQARNLTKKKEIQEKIDTAMSQIQTIRGSV